MNLCLAKTGLEMFDALHAYGLGVLIACATRQPATLVDNGLTYSISSPLQKLPALPDIGLSDVLELPELGELQLENVKDAGSSLKLANLDGLLALMLCYPGTRIVSIDHLVVKRRFDEASMNKALSKVRHVLDSWELLLARRSKDGTPWFIRLLREYDSKKPVVPVPVRCGQGTSISMTVDPALGLSLRRIASDARLTNKTTVSFKGTRFAWLLVAIGAARFLRAQRVAHRGINLYVPLASKMEISPDLALPILPHSRHACDRSLLLRWLSQYLKPLPDANLKGLAYQFLSGSSGVAQSISLTRGYLDFDWLDQVERGCGRGIIKYWFALLVRPRNEVPFETDNLIDFLIDRRLSAWDRHLLDVTLALRKPEDWEHSFYREDDVMKIVQMSEGANTIPLAAVLERKEGTLRFARAIRRLGRYNTSAHLDAVDGLQSVQTRDELLRVLARAVQECVLQNAKTPDIKVPNDDDLKYLLEDVEVHGAYSVASLIIILSHLRYPARRGQAPAAPGAEEDSAIPEEEEDSDERN